ncbi:zinc finger protein JAGGED-like [Mangifera indica]|uniref:zinc finger protein JAGGED-like n=1 Tax=Mangifera indica TaxID=29780 RepID=UPI001CF9D59D|nr:zinc finger protein JAGGED-like [Mangifera indica]
MRPERNPLDLNNLPEDFSSRDGKQVFDDSSSASGYRKKKSGAKDGKDECGKVYECRFCSLKFCKSQALGGHMNRHRQERETETLNRARQLVFSNDNLAAAQGPPPHPGCITAGSYHPAGHIGDPFRSVYSSRLFSGSSSTMIPPPPPPPPPSQPPYPYPSPSRLTSYSTQYPPHHPMNEYYVGHVLTSPSSHSHSQHPHQHQNLNYMGAAGESNYTCIGAPVGHGFIAGSSRGGSGGADLTGGSSGARDGPLNNQEEGLNWGRSYAAGGGGTHTQPRLDPPF